MVGLWKTVAKSSLSKTHIFEFSNVDSASQFSLKCPTRRGRNSQCDTSVEYTVLQFDMKLNELKRSFVCDDFWKEWNSLHITHGAERMRWAWEEAGGLACSESKPKLLISSRERPSIRSLRNGKSHGEYRRTSVNL